MVDLRGLIKVTTFTGSVHFFALRASQRKQVLGVSATSGMKSGQFDRK